MIIKPVKGSSIPEPNEDILKECIEENKNLSEEQKKVLNKELDKKKFKKWIKFGPRT